ncbi:hypothetical protein IMSAGC022_00379 [Alistipes sp.]|nr:hypothetical protein IMSAGC022_00379 [Alistipes sp.]
MVVNNVCSASRRLIFCVKVKGLFCRAYLLTVLKLISNGRLNIGAFTKIESIASSLPKKVQSVRRAFCQSFKAVSYIYRLLLACNSACLYSYSVRFPFSSSALLTFMSVSLIWIFFKANSLVRSVKNTFKKAFKAFVCMSAISEQYCFVALSYFACSNFLFFL